MNYYQARQRQDNGRWQYTVMNDGKVQPVGYCAEGCDHETAEEANACYKRFVLDHRLNLDRKGDPNTKRRCEFPGCDEFTSNFAEADHRLFALCEEHRTREVVETLFEVGQRVSSW